MKKFLTAIMAFALVATVSVYAETTTSLTSSSSTAMSSSSKSKGYTSGKTAGKAILSIYKNYKKEGTLNLKSASNIVNITLIGTSLKGVKDQDSDYKSDFNTGLLEGLGLKSDSSSSSSSSILESLTGASGSMSSFSSSSSSSEESEISSVLTDIFSKLK